MESLCKNDVPRLLNDDSKLSFTLECANSISWEIHLDLGKLVFSDNFESKYGICQADYNYNFEKFLDLHLNPHKDQILESIDKHLYGETDFAAIGEITLFNDKCNLHWLNARGKCIKYDQNVIYGVSVDITERKKLEEILAQKKADDKQKMINELRQTVCYEEFMQYLNPIINEITKKELPPEIKKTDEYIQVLSKLTRREQEVINSLLCGNVSYKDISTNLNISVNTVKTHLKHIYNTAGVSNIASLLSFLQR